MQELQVAVPVGAAQACSGAKVPEVQGRQDGREATPEDRATGWQEEKAMPSKQRRDVLAEVGKLDSAKKRLRERKRETAATLKRLQGQQPQKPDIL